MKILSALPHPKSRSFRGRIAAAAAAVSACLLLTAPLQAAPLNSDARQNTDAVVRLPGHLAAVALRSATPMGRKRGGDIVPLVLSLPPRDPNGLDRLLTRLYTPGDPLFHHFITPTEFADRFSQTPQTYAAVAAFARANGLTVTNTSPNRLLLDVSGPASAVETAFRVHLQNYAANGRIFFAPDAQPAIPLSLAGRIGGVAGLDNAEVWHPHLQPSLGSLLPHGVGTGVDQGMTPRNIKTAYNLTATTLTGTGRTLGLFELDGYAESDVTAYEGNFSLPKVPLQNILIDGFNGVPSATSGPFEVTLDIELMTALAPGASKILVYEAPNSTVGVLDTYGKMASDNSAKEISSSWGLPEDDIDQSTVNAENVIFQQMAVQGQSVYIAAGDSGAYGDSAKPTLLVTDDPASQPSVTAVGGTSLSLFSLGGAYASETTWAYPAVTGTNASPASGGGGGISSFWPLPSYQTGITGLASQAHRNVPDISLNADPNTGYSVYIQGNWYVFGGTSCAAPLWAAFTALINQQRQANTEADLGFANPLIYQTGISANYKTVFHDINDGSTNLFYPATTGYDNATGWGSFNGIKLINLFAPGVVATNPVSALTLTPASVVGGLTTKGTVTLANPAPAGGATVTLIAATGPASVPATVVVPAGASSTDFVVSTTAVTVSTTDVITASYSGGIQSATLTVLPAPKIIVPTSLAVNPSSIGGGSSTTATVTLSGPAPTGGLTVTLASDNPAVTVPATVVVPAGATSATFTVTTAVVTTQTTANLSATANSVTVTAAVTILLPALSSTSLTPLSVVGSQPSSLTVNLTLPALTGGAVISLTSSSPLAVIPATVTVPAGQTTASVAITTSVVTVSTPVTIKAVYAGTTKQTTLTLTPFLATGVTLAPASVVGGAPSTGTVTLNAPAPSGGITVALTSSDPAAQVPATVAIGAGVASGTFSVTTVTVPAVVTATVTAALNGQTKSGTLAIQPILVTALSVAPTSVQIGTPSIGTVTLNAPASPGGVTVALSSSTNSATVPATLVISAGASTATFTVATPHAGGAVITAQLAGASQTANLTVVTPPGITYPAGLNFLSAPYEYSGVPLDGLFGYTGVVLATWQTDAGAYALTPTAPADELHLGRGYWVNLPNAVTLTSVGTPADTTKDFPIALLPGWNQIGDPFLTSVALGKVSIVSGSTAVSFSQATTGSPLLVSSLVYRYAAKSGSTAAGYVWVRDTDTLQPGLGYWVYAYSAVTMTIPHP